MAKHYETNLSSFIEEERKFLDSIKAIDNWDVPDWGTINWLPHRGTMHTLAFTQWVPGKKRTDPLPPDFSEFCKALIVYIQRTKKTGFMAINKYLTACKRLYSVMKERSETSPTQLTRWHFERCVELLIESNYKNLYDAAISLQLIASIIDLKGLTQTRIEFKHTIKISSSRHDYIPLSDLGSDDVRKNDEKLPSYESLKAYAICTNNPTSDQEEIILRTIDLLIVMGQRINEVTLLPYDCWVEQPILSKKGAQVKDGHGNVIIKTGIRYYAEKKFESRVHWLADQDIPFARRAVQRLKILTEPIRKVAKFQEENPNRVWDIDPDQILNDTFVAQYMDDLNFQYLNIRIRKKGIPLIKFDKINLGRKGHEGYGYNRMYYYRAGDVEDWIKKKFLKNDVHIQLKERVSNGFRTVLKTSDLLCIRFSGAFNTREVTLFNKLCPGRINVAEINQALGANTRVKSIFEKRGLTEADKSRIELTSHQPRHWRNTLYELAGMSNVQQALAMGRQRLDQNATYQHTSILERTQSHKEFLSFNSPAEKVQFLHNGIRERKIQGEITELYHKLKIEKGKELAESFLATHANAIHLTPFGGCTHDFSQAPCPKHLQCWNGCSHLHRTNTPGESERIVEQIELSKLALEAMKKESDGEYGADVWTKDLENKIENMQKALDTKPSDKPIKVFPNGKPVTLDISQRKGSSVSEK
jgi:hypothetical protein